ncbi:MAG TPA: 50S ribosomal protein L3 [archaeon]|nr:50S ribosomal protein L3 [archaeon]
MGAHKPRSGSLAYYPRVRAKSPRAAFSTFPQVESKEAKVLNFYGYKAGMMHVFGKNAHEKSVSYGQLSMIPATVIECPPVKVIGVRVYTHTPYGSKVLGEISTDKPDKNLRSRIKAFKKKGKKKSKAAGKDEQASHYQTIEDLEKMKNRAENVVLVVQVQPGLTGIGKKKADITELTLTGTIEQQFGFAKEKFGKDVKVSEVFSPQQFVDVKGVDKGKGFTGVVKRFNVRVHRPKAKKHRYVGSIGPWHPATVMWTVPRAGQLGYQTRTEYNKRVLFVQSDVAAINPSKGFNNYGMVKNEYIIITGSVPGPAKRIVGLRVPTRLQDPNMSKFTDLQIPQTGAKA